MARGSKPAVTQPIGRTGSAPIVKQGHTASGRFGDDPNLKGNVVREPRDLSVK
jgi:hypothetical protein